MRRAVLLPIALLALTAPAAAQNPIAELFRYKPAPPPVAGSCPAAWYGEFSGQRYDSFTEKYTPFSARGCFDNEAACRIWQHRAITHLGQGPIYFTRCRPT